MLVGRLVRIFVLFAVSGPLVCHGQTATDPSAHQGGTISGSVVRTDNSQPVARVTVTMEPVPDDSNRAAFDESDPRNSPEKLRAALNARFVQTQTDRSGRFSFDDIPPGHYSLTTSKTAFVDERADLPLPGTPITVVAGQTSEIVIAIEPAGAIVGRVLNEDGEPMPHVAVEALRFHYEDGSRKLRTMGADQTNDVGEYRIYGLAPHKYYVRAVDYGERQDSYFEARRQHPSDFVYAPVFFPDARSVVTATRVEVRSGDEQRVNFNLAPSRIYHVSGTAAGFPPGNDWSLGLYMVEKDSGDHVSVGIIEDTQGRFRADNVLPGDYWLITNASTFAGDHQAHLAAAARTSVSVKTADVEGVRVTLEPAKKIQLKGKVTVDPPVAGVDLSRMSIAFDSADRDDPMTYSSLHSEISKISKTGEFTATFEGMGGVLQPHLTADGVGFEDYYTKSVLADGNDLIDAGVGLIPTTGSTLELVLDPFGARVDGAVLNEQKKPAPGAFVVCVPEAKLRARRELYITDTSNQQGHYVLRGLRPGNYKLYAFDKMDLGALYNADFLRPLEDMGEALTVREKDTATKDLQVLHQTED